MYGGAIATDLGRHFEDSYGQLASLIMTLARFHILTRWKQKQHKTDDNKNNRIKHDEQQLKIQISDRL